MSTPEPRRCTVPTPPDGSMCGREVLAKGMCYGHYHDAYNASRRKPGARRARELGADPISFLARVPRDLGRAVRTAVEMAQRADPTYTEAQWLEDALRAHLPPELTQVK